MGGMKEKASVPAKGTERTKPAAKLLEEILERKYGVIPKGEELTTERARERLAEITEAGKGTGSVLDQVVRLAYDMEKSDAISTGEKDRIIDGLLAIVEKVKASWPDPREKYNAELYLLQDKEGYQRELGDKQGAIDALNAQAGLLDYMFSRAQRDRSKRSLEQSLSEVYARIRKLEGQLERERDF